MNAKEALKFIEDHFIECPEVEKCLRCNTGREAIEVLRKAVAKLKGER
jgi:hypothetical protein